MKCLLASIASVAMGLILASSASAITSSVYSYSTVDYDSATDTVTGFSSTSHAYVGSVYYEPYVQIAVYDEDGNFLRDGDFQQTEGGAATVSVQTTGNGCQYYTSQAWHALHAYYYVEDVYIPANGGGYYTGYDDLYNFSDVGSSGFPVYTGSVYFYGYGPRVIIDGDWITLGETEAVGSGDCTPPTVTIKKSDDSELASPFRLGKTGTVPFTIPSPTPTPIDRTQHLKATVDPANQASSVSISVSSKVTISNVSANNSTGVITFDIVGNTASSSSGDSWIKAKYPGSSGATRATKTVSVVVPSKIATPHDTTGTYTAQNKVLSMHTRPVIVTDEGDVALETLYGRDLSITVEDQFNDLIGGIYLNAVVAEDPGGGTYYNLNSPLTSSSTYTDFVGEGLLDSVVVAGSSAATAWPGASLASLVPNTGPTQNFSIKVDGFSLSPAISGRYYTATTGPNAVTITWPN